MTREQPVLVFAGTRTSRLVEIKVTGIRSTNQPSELLGMMLKWTPPTLIPDTCVLSVGTQHRWFNDHWFKMYTAS